MMSLPDRIDLDQYRTRAKELLKLARAQDPQSIDRVRANHPEHLSAPAGLKLADTQLVIARELGFPSWAKLKAHALFSDAVSALDAGDLAALDALLTKNRTLVHARRRIGEWYDGGYFGGATLLHHVAGNPIRRPLPPNIVDVTRLLVDRGADPNAKTDPGWTTIGLILTGKQPSRAGVAMPLVDLLRSHGARDKIDGGDTLTMSLLNEAPETAEALVKRGVAMDVRHAAGLGRFDALERLLSPVPDRETLEEALAFACVRNQPESVKLLLAAGAKGDVLVRHGGRSACTALHEAANRGHASIVRMLLDNGADPAVIEPNWNGTPAGWARHGGHPEIAELLDRYVAAPR